MPACVLVCLYVIARQYIAQFVINLFISTKCDGHAKKTLILQAVFERIYRGNSQNQSLTLFSILYDSMTCFQKQTNKQTTSNSTYILPSVHSIAAHRWNTNR